MTYESRSCMFLLLSAVAGFLSVAGEGITLKYVCPGDSVQAFQNIEFSCTANVHLVKHVDENAEIAVWSIQNCIRNESLLPEYQGKLIFDQNGAITIKNFNNSDQANYIVIVNYNSKMDTLPKIYEVQLSLMVAPTKDCKPMIKQLEKILIARLNSTYCGQPVAVPYWKDSDSGFYTNESILELTPGMEARKYIACIKGDALTCVKNVTSHDYCTTFTTEGSKSPPVSSETSIANERIVTTPPVSSETSGANEHIALCIILIILFILAMVVLPVIFFLCRRRKSCKVRQRYKESKQLEPKPMTEQASTMHQLSHNSYLMRMKRPDPGHCAFCGQEKSAMFILPCEHLGLWYMPTCIKCSISGGPCEQCMVSKRKSMEFATWTVLTDSARN